MGSSLVMTGPTLSHFDRIYVGEALEAKGGWCHTTLGMTFFEDYSIINHFQLHQNSGSFQPRILHTIYTVIEVKEQLTTQSWLPVNDSSTYEKLLVKLTRASNLLHEMVKTRSKDAQEKRQGKKLRLVAFLWLQQIYPSCSWTTRHVSISKQELIMT